MNDDAIFFLMQFLRRAMSEQRPYIRLSAALSRMIDCRLMRDSKRGG